ncbi:uncharacterized protein LOC144583768 isoform X2 [Pogona vitticeps]
MKRSWLLLGAVALALEPAALAASLGRKDQARRRPPLRGSQPCVGCYTLLSAPLFPEERSPAFKNATFSLLVEPSPWPPHPAIRMGGIEESTLSDPESSKLNETIHTA